MSSHAEPPPASPSPGSSATAEQRAQAVVEQVIARRNAGEAISDEQVLRDHPDLLGVLERQLARAAMVQQVRATARTGEHALEKLLDSLDIETTERAVPAKAMSARDRSAEPAPRKVKMQPPAADEKPTSDPPRITISEVAAVATNPPAATSAVDVGRLEDVGSTSTVRFRPQHRPPLALLRVDDDGQSTGQLVRLREADFTIGRQRGDLVIRHDSRISSRHARIERRHEQTGWTWTLRDLESTNGVFVKATRVQLRDGDQLIFACRTVRFVDSQASDRSPRLEEVRTDGPGEQLLLASEPAELRIGRDSSRCTPFLATEPMLDPEFARLERDAAGHWTIHAPNALNGLWIRVDQSQLVDGAAFQLGEQRFSFHAV